MKQLKRQCLKWLARLLFKIIYRVEVRGLDNYPREEGNYVVIANHVSYLDGPLLMSFIPNMPVFAINKDVNENVRITYLYKHVNEHVNKTVDKSVSEHVDNNVNVYY